MWLIGAVVWLQAAFLASPAAVASDKYARTCVASVALDGNWTLMFN